jgi:acetolactate synthase-1/2/3 large subunit
MIVAGSRLRHQQSRDMSAFFPQPIAQIDIDPQAQGRTYPAETFLCADSAASLDLLADAVAGTIAIDPAYQSDLVAAKTEAIAEINGRLGPYAGFPGALRQALPRDGLFVRDITLSNNVWGHHTFPVLSPHDSLFPVAAGIGTALPLGIGAALAASGRKTVVLCGDGGFFLNPGELWTAVQEQADIVILVMNDNGYSVIRHIQDGLHGGRHYFTELLNPDLAGLAELAGIRFFRVREARQFGAVMAEALGLQGPVLVEVDMGSIGPFPYGYTPPKAAASGGRP